MSNIFGIIKNTSISNKSVNILSIATHTLDFLNDVINQNFNNDIDSYFSAICIILGIACYYLSAFVNILVQRPLTLSDYNTLISALDIQL